MSSEGDDVYVMRAQGEEADWISPTPVRTAIIEVLAEATDVTDDDVDGLDSYVALDDLRAVVDGPDDQLSFAVEGHEIRVDSDGDIEVAD
jgi:hypothetical protein